MLRDGLRRGFEATDRMVEVERLDEIRDEPAVETELESEPPSSGREDKYSWTRASPNVKKFCPITSDELCFDRDEELREPLLALHEPPTQKSRLNIEPSVNRLSTRGTPTLPGFPIGKRTYLIHLNSMRNCWKRMSGRQWIF